VRTSFALLRHLIGPLWRANPEFQAYVARKDRLRFYSNAFFAITMLMSGHETNGKCAFLSKPV
jgi:hypothetical protein